MNYDYDVIAEFSPREKMESVNVCVYNASPIDLYALGLGLEKLNLNDVMITLIHFPRLGYALKFDTEYMKQKGVDIENGGDIMSFVANKIGAFDEKDACLKITSMIESCANVDY